MHYTSGTTGKPKGVKRPLADLDPDVSAELFTFLLQLFGIMPGDDDVHLSTSPNYHTAVTTFAGNSLHMKHTVVCMDKWDAEETLRLIERYGCTHTHMVPTQFIRMLQLPDEVKQQVRRVGDEVGDPRGRAVPGRHEAQDARLVGPGDLGVLRRDRRRRHDRAARRVAEVPGHGRARLAELRAEDHRRRRQRHGDRRARHRVDEDGRGPHVRVQGRQRRRPTSRTTPRASSPSATSATSTTTATCSSATARAT